MAYNYPQSSHTNKAEKSSRFKRYREKSSPYHRSVESPTVPSSIFDDNVLSGFEIAEEEKCADDNLQPMKSYHLEDMIEDFFLELTEPLTFKKKAIRTENVSKEMRRLLRMAEQYATFFACCEIAILRNMESRINTLPADPTSQTLVLQRTRAATFLRRNVFRKGRLLGEGTFGSVYLTSTQYSPKKYALKIVSIKVPENASRKERNEYMAEQVLASRERDAMLTAEHPFICKLKASWVERLHSKACLSYMFLMEYAPFGDLDEFITSMFHFLVPKKVHQFDNTQLVERIISSKENESAENKPANPYARRRLIYIYAAEMTSALAYLHYLGLVHRDFKPRNLLIGENYHLRVTDFGYTSSQKAHLSFELHKIACTGHPALRENPLEDLSERNEWLFGTIAYCQTPEMISKQITDTKTFYPMDMWALGITLFELYGGLHPFIALVVKNDPAWEELVKTEIKDFRRSRLLTEPLYSTIIDDEYYRALVSALICEMNDRPSSMQLLECIRDKVEDVAGTSIEALNNYRLDFMVDVLGRLEDGGSPGYENEGWSPYSGVGTPHCEGATALAQTFPFLDSPKMSDQ